MEPPTSGGSMRVAEKVAAVSSSDRRRRKPPAARRTGQSRGGGGKKGGGRAGRDRSGDPAGRRGKAQERRGETSGGTRRSDSKADVGHGKARGLPTAGAGLPRHVVEALIRVTPSKRQNAALAALAAAAEAFSDGQYHAAVRKAQHAKELASRDATIREILGLASYRIGDWATALRELRTYRRLSGETTHMPVEMDVLRALGRSEEVTEVWEEFRRRGGNPATSKEAKVVYASHLIDRGDLAGAESVVGRLRATDDPWPEDLRLWYTAARIAALNGDRARARDLADRIVVADPSFPGLDELDRLVDGSP
jgi:hypothetical protein